MAYNKINWQAGEKIADAHVTIDGQRHYVTEASYMGDTPITPENLNHMDEQIGILSNDYILEQGGSNATNFYTKWASGKLEQWGHVAVTSAINVQMGAVYRSNTAQTITFEVPFSNASYKVMFGARAAINSAYAAEMTAGQMVCFPITYSSVSAATRYYFWYAIGSWK